MRPHFRAAAAAIAAAIALLLLPGRADAGLFRAYLSVGGNDADPCTLQHPCRLLPAALAAIDSGGEIWLLDSANYNTGPVSIAKSVSILAVPGAVGSIAGVGGDAIEIATPGVKVALRNLKIRDLGGGGNGILMTAGASLTIDRCEISGFSTSTRSGVRVAAETFVTVVDTLLRDNFHGLRFENGTDARVIRTTAFNNFGYGIFALTTAGGLASLSVSDSVTTGNGSGGILANGQGASDLTAVVTRTVSSGIESIGARMTVSDSTSSGTASGYSVNGFSVVNGTMTVSGSTASNVSYGFSAGPGATLTVSACVASRNGVGVFNASTGTTVVAATTVTGNTFGLRNDAGGTLRSLGNNTVAGNGTDTVGTITTLGPM